MGFGAPSGARDGRPSGPPAWPGRRVVLAGARRFVLEATSQR